MPGISTNLFPASLISTAVLGDRPRRRCWSAFGRMWSTCIPKSVVILAGTNDIAGNTGPMRLEDVEADLASLAEIARANDIKVIYSSVLPIHNYTERSKDFFAQRSPEKILALNKWLKDYCDTGACLYLDYFTSMVDDKGLLQKDLADDGLHPNAAGHKIMAPLAEAAIEKALK